MAMLRFSGGRSFMGWPAMMTLPAVAGSRAGIIRKVLVWPQAEGPSRQTTSPADTDKSASLTAVKSPKTLVILRISMVDMLLPDRAEGDAAQQMLLQEEGDEEHRDQEQRLDRRQQRPVGAAAAGRHRLVHRDRHRAGVGTGQEQREQELVPGQDEAEDEGR